MRVVIDKTGLILEVHQDGAKRPTNLPCLGKVVSPTEDVADRQRKRFLMITRRNCLIGISAVLVSAPAIVRVESLMKVRGIAVPIHPKNYYGFCDRLCINSRYQNGELRGRTLIRLIDEGLLKHIPPAVLAYDLAKWGTANCHWPPAKNEEEFFGRELRGPTLLASSKDRPYDYKPRDFSYVSWYGSNRSI